jgi:MFS family permease
MKQRISELRVLPLGLAIISVYTLGWAIVLYLTLANRALAIVLLVILVLMISGFAIIGFWTVRRRKKITVPRNSETEMLRKGILGIVGSQAILVAFGAMSMLYLHQPELIVPILALPFGLGAFATGYLMNRAFDAIVGTIMTLAAALAVVVVFGSGYAAWINPVVAFCAAFGCAAFGAMFVLKSVTLIGEVESQQTQAPSNGSSQPAGR